MSLQELVLEKEDNLRFEAVAFFGRAEHVNSNNYYVNTLGDVCDGATFSVRATATTGGY